MRARQWSWLAKTIVAAAMVSAIVLGSCIPAQAGPAAPSGPAVGHTVQPGGHAAQPAPAQPAIKLRGRLSAATGEVTVFVQFTGQGAYAQTQPLRVRRGGQAPVRAPGLVGTIRSGIHAKADSVAAALGDKPLYVTTNTIPGVAIRGDAAAVRRLAARADVVKITPIVPKTVDNKDSVQTVKALNTWTAHKQTGAGAVIALIDTGIDYTHADLGGPGTTEAYSQAKQLTDLPGVAVVDAGGKPLRDASKVIGGYDLVGDAYTGDNQPVPDGNPLDCAPDATTPQASGHGSHVAGTAAGYGVNADGSTFRGDYAALTPAAVNAMAIGPGSAPNAKLVSLRVFGCMGYTNLIGAGLDRALDPNGDGTFVDRADIINLSVGSSFTPTDDPDNDIINELTTDGVLTVAAAGNDGDQFDVGGSPGNARSALAVADSVGADSTLNLSSSRGVHGSAGILKPDVAAPGTNISSIAAGTGSGAKLMTGTSMASPLVAGIAALAYGAGITDPQVLKSRIMSTARQDIHGSSGTVYPPDLAGSGLVDASAAFGADTYAYATDDPSLVSLTFGVHEVAAPLTLRRTVTIRNTGAAARIFTPGFHAATTMPGALISVSGTAVTVPAALNGTPGSATVSVTLSVPDPTKLTKRLPATMSAVQGGLARQYLAYLSGRLVLTETAASAASAPALVLKVPVQAAPKPIASMRQAATVRFSDASSTSAALPLSGTGLNQGSGTEAYNSLVAPFELGYTSPKQDPASLSPASLQELDLHYAGAFSNVPAVAAAGSGADKIISFGISTWADWPALISGASFQVDIDTNRDGITDYQTVTERAAGADAIMADTYRLSDNTLVSSYYVNGTDGSTDSNSFDTNVLSLPVGLADLGISGPAYAPLTYKVSTYSIYHADAAGRLIPVDTTPSISWDPINPGLWFQTGDPSYNTFADNASTRLTLHRSTTTTSATALLLHLHNGSGTRDQITTATAPAGVCQTGTAAAAPVRNLSAAALHSAADLVAADSGGVLWNYGANGRGALNPRTKIGQGWSGLKAGFVTDWNHDGVFDLLAQWKDGRLTYYPGRLSGGFNPAQAVGTGWQSFQVLAGNWCTAQQYPGVVASDSAGTLWFYPNASGGALSARTRIGTGWGGLYLTMADYDRDGCQDILARRPDGSLLLYRSNGVGSFISEHRPTVGAGWSAVTSMSRLTGFQGVGTQGIMARFSDGRLFYYPIRTGTWGTRSQVGSGWNGYTIFR